MESCQILRTPLFISPSISSKTRNNNSISQFSITHPKFYQKKHFIYISAAALKNARGFDPTPKKKKNSNKLLTKKPIINKDDEEDDGNDDDQGVIPEVVTNRMMKRVGLSVGIPLFVGLLFFPFFYYLKVGLKIDIPTWVPFIVSFIFFGSALLGVSYGIVSSSWDPMREGSLLGWNEAKKNWPVFWQSLRGRSGKY
ncbi:Pam68 protein [Thalictrum thalictroides]|uniref:Pam68 protein n=1 Tax=Thalictrum thalictroides TaxID=46969 RepID=A0A7J6X9C1_THATH|nr:Pam68 protein [Thalictrum thalictroides]